MLCCAVTSHQPLVVSELLKIKRANPNTRTPEGMTPLVIAAVSGAVDITRILIDHGADLNIRAADGFSALMYAPSYDHVRVAIALIEAGANPELVDQNGRTARDLCFNDGAKKYILPLLGG